MAISPQEKVVTPEPLDPDRILTVFMLSYYVNFAQYLTHTTHRHTKHTAQHNKKYLHFQILLWLLPDHENSHVLIIELKNHMYSSRFVSVRMFWLRWVTVCSIWVSIRCRRLTWWSMQVLFTTQKFNLLSCLCLLVGPYYIHCWLFQKVKH